MERPHLSATEERSRAVLDKLSSLLGLTDGEIAGRLGMTRQAVQQRRSGATRIRSGDEVRLAEMLGVPPDVFRLEPVEAIRWVLDHRPDLVTSSSRCIVLIVA